jgi:hypothetical protein
MSILKDRHFVFNFWLLVFIAALHNVASFFYFYWTLWWFDIFMHFLGGFWIASVCLWIFYSNYFRQSSRPSRVRLFVFAVLSSIVLGLAWETFELVAGIILFPEYIPDSSLDMVMDTIGGVFAYLFYIRNYYLNDEQ